MIIRKAAIFASQRGSSDMDSFWPIESGVPDEDIASQFITEEYKEWYRKMKAKHLKN